jgi:hypothetical protein
MFGFFKKVPKPASPPSKAASAPNYDAILLAAIVKLRAGDQSAVPAFLEALSHQTVTVLLREPGKMQTALLLELAGNQHLAVFTKPQLAEPWQARGYPHTLQIPMASLAPMVSSDQVGLSINPDHPLFGYPLPPPHFKHFREVLASLRPPLKEGGLYHVQNEDGTFSVLKILKLDEHGVHIRQYSNAWPAPPFSVDESKLYMAGPDRQPGERLGMGHLPIAKKSFAGWNATFVQQAAVSEDELDGYKMWFENKGGYF